MAVRSPYLRLVREVRATLVGGPPSEEDHNILNWYASTALFGIVDGSMWVFLPVFLARLGASPSLLGLYSSLPALMVIAFSIPTGVLVDRATDQMAAWKRIAFGMRMFYPLVILAPFFLPRTVLPTAIVVLWALRVIPDAAGTSLWTAIAGRAVSPRRRPHVNGTRWALLSLVSASCQALAGRWLDVGPFPGAYQAMFTVAFAATMAEWWFFGRLRVPLLPKREDPPAALGERVRAYLRPLAEHGPFVRFAVGTFAYRVALNMPAALFTLLWVRELGASNGLIGLRGTVGYAGLMTGYLFWGRNANRLGHRRVLTAGALGTAAYAIVSAALPSAVWLVPVAVLWGVSAPGIDVGLFDLLLHACPPGKEARFVSVNQFAANLAIFVGPLLGVALASVTSVRAALAVAGALQVLATAGFRLLPKDV